MNPDHVHIVQDNFKTNAREFIYSFNLDVIETLLHNIVHKDSLQPNINTKQPRNNCQNARQIVWFEPICLFSGIHPGKRPLHIHRFKVCNRNHFSLGVPPLPRKDAEIIQHLSLHLVLLLYPVSNCPPVSTLFIDLFLCTVLGKLFTLSFTNFILPSRSTTEHFIGAHEGYATDH